MTDLSAPPAPVGGAQPGPAGPVQMCFAGPARQRRLTVLLRLVLAIPHFIVLYLLSLAAGLTLIVAWFAALFTGRAPVGIAGFLTGVLRWDMRVYAYLFLLTDSYPPFTLADDEGYPVRLTSSPGRMSRLSVLLRIFLAIPAGIVAGIAVYGAMGLVGFVAWLITLVSGQMPEPLHEAYAAVLRFQARYSGYVYLLTEVYPRGLFGDKPAAAVLTGVDPWAPPLGQTPAQEQGEPLAAPAGAGVGGSPASAEAPAVSAAPAADEALAAGESPADTQPPADGGAQIDSGIGRPADSSTPPAPAGPWRMVLSEAGKRMVVLFLVLGAIYAAVVTTVDVIGFSNSVNAVQAETQLKAAHNQLFFAMRSYSTSVQACQGSPSALACVDKSDVRASRAFAAFGARIAGLPVPSADSGDLAQLQAATAKAQQAFQKLSTATSVSQYQQDVASTNIQAALSQFDMTARALLVALNAQLTSQG